MSTGVKFRTFRGGPSGLSEAETTRPCLSGNEVLISITASGLCGGDLIFKGNDVCLVRYIHSEILTCCQMVLGHEGVGTVIDAGPNVSRLSKGDRVGWGFLQDSCGHCRQCLDGAETFCPERKMYGSADLDQGSFAFGIVKKEDRIFAIPKELSDEEAAPLMCAGATVFNALDTYSAKPSQTIGVIGIGGLGHLAIQVSLSSEPH